MKPKAGSLRKINKIDNPLAKLTKWHRDSIRINKIRNKMVDLGLNETLSYILINDKNVHQYTNDKFQELKLLDPMTEERNTLI